MAVSKRTKLRFCELKTMLEDKSKNGKLDIVFNIVK